MLPVCLNAASVFGQVRIVNSNESAITKRKDYSNVAVWLREVGTPVALSTRRAQMLQKNKTFAPHLLVIAAGTYVDFPNLDPIFHNAFSNFNGQVFDIGLYAPGSSRTVRLSRPGVVRVFCNIHPTMSAVIVVADSPYSTTTAADGSFSINNVPEGKYELHFFHERATPETLNKLTKFITVESRTDAGMSEVSETGYLPMPHKNKYGNDYPPHAGEQNYALPQ